MSANDYYNSTRPERQQQEQQPYYQSYGELQPYQSSYDARHIQQPNSQSSRYQQSINTSLPDYRTNAPSVTSFSHTQETSPFEAPFDDHVYPIGSQTPNSQHDARYFPPTIGRQESSSSFRDDIPLQDHAVAPGKMDSTDHVYDAPVNSQRYEQGQDKRSSGGRFGMFKGKKIPWVVYGLTLVQVIVFIVELIKNYQLTGSPIEIHPSFNPMIGPSPYVLINMGSRYVPCMHNVNGIQDSTINISWFCPNTTSSTQADCTLSNLCGFSGVPNPLYDGNIKQSPEPNQWFRFIIPMFMHAGIIHIGFNLLLQLSLGKEMEILIGPVRFFLVYICSGIFGFVLGGNYAATGISSTGASGCLFGIIALSLLDLFYTWEERRSPWKDFAYIMLDVVVSLVLGLLPGLDNFSHIGGILMGLVLGICLMRSPNALQKRIDRSDPPYTPVIGRSFESDSENGGVRGFFRNPLGFFQGRKPSWWAWLLIRAAALVAILIVFILLLNNFYVYRKTCSWCKYLSCLDISNWCDVGNIQVKTISNKRSVFDSWDSMAKLAEMPFRA